MSLKGVYIMNKLKMFTVPSGQESEQVHDLEILCEKPILTKHKQNQELSAVLNNTMCC